MNRFFVLIILLFLGFVGFISYKYYLVLKENENLKEILKDLGELAGIDNYGSLHLHADIKIFINGKELVIYRPENFEKNKFVHFHETTDPSKPNENVIHIHAKGITLKQFLNTLNIKLNNNCLTVDNINYCNNEENQLKVYVNNKKLDDYENYVIKDLDRILISYGPDDKNRINEELNKVGNYSKLHSSKFNFECNEELGC